MSSDFLKSHFLAFFFRAPWEQLESLTVHAVGKRDCKLPVSPKKEKKVVVVLAGTILDFIIVPKTANTNVYVDVAVAGITGENTPRQPLTQITQTTLHPNPTFPHLPQENAWQWIHYTIRSGSVCRTQRADFIASLMPANCKQTWPGRHR